MKLAYLSVETLPLALSTGPPYCRHLDFGVKRYSLQSSGTSAAVPLTQLFSDVRESATDATGSCQHLGPDLPTGSCTQMPDQGRLSSGRVLPLGT